MSDLPMDQLMKTSQSKSQLITIDLENVKGKPKRLEAMIPSNYRPDLTDKSYRPDGLDDSIYHKLGQGTTGVAVAAIREVKGVFETRTEQVVLKKYNIDHQVDYTSILREFQNLQYLMHDHIAVMKDSFWSFGKGETLNHVWIVTERMDFKLSDFFRKTAKKDNTAEPEKRDHRHLATILVQILQALDYLHQRGIMHRDVKPDNIGISRSFDLKLFDFGVARPINDMNDLTQCVSTPLYLPLEVQLMEQYDWSIDIWATGLVAFEFLNHPFYPTDVVNSASKERIKQRILDVFGVPGNKYQEFFKSKLINEKPRDGTFNAFLTTACTRFGPKLQDLNEENFQDLLGKMLCIDPRRPLARELLQHKYLRASNTGLLEKKKRTNKHEPTRNERDKETLIKILKNFSTQL